MPHGRIGADGRSPAGRHVRHCLLALIVALSLGPGALAQDALRPPPGEAEIIEYLFFRAAELRDQGEEDQSLSILELVASSRPDVALYRETLGDAYLATGTVDGATRALAEYRAALTNDPTRERARQGLIQASIASGRILPALEVLEDLFRGGGQAHPEYLPDLVSFYLMAEETARGISMLSRTRVHREAEAVVLISLGALHRANGDDATAIALAERAAGDRAAPDEIRELAGEMAAAWRAEAELNQ